MISDYFNQTCTIKRFSAEYQTWEQIGTYPCRLAKPRNTFQISNEHNHVQNNYRLYLMPSTNVKVGDFATVSGIGDFRLSSPYLANNNHYQVDVTWEDALMFDIVYLVPVTKSRNGFGEIIEADGTPVMIYANKKEYNESEYNLNLISGNKTIFVFDVNVSDYNNETKLYYNNVLYNVVKTIYKNNGKNMEIVSEMSGDKIWAMFGDAVWSDFGEDTWVTIGV